MSRRIRDIAPPDYPAIIAINNAAVPSMNAQNAASLNWLVTHATYARVVESVGTVEAFLLGLPPGTGYDSENYEWFSQRYTEFLYVDRIAVAESARDRGHGTALYDDIATFALGKWPRILAEVNLDPPNPRSVAFHERHGFVRVGELEHAQPGSHSKRVLMMERTIR